MDNEEFYHGAGWEGYNLVPGGGQTSTSGFHRQLSLPKPVQILANIQRTTVVDVVMLLARVHIHADNESLRPAPQASDLT